MGVTAPTASTIALSDAQRKQIAEWVAWWDEGENRFVHWELRDRDEETLASIQGLLDDSGLSHGRTATTAQLRRLLDLVRQIAPNPSLDGRIAEDDVDLTVFGQAVRELLYGQRPLAERVARFVERRGIGLQTVSQLLCAALPTRYPMVSPV